MEDIVERLRRKVFSNPQVGAPHKRTVEWQAADEIERLREALRKIIALQKANPGPLTLDDYEYIGYEVCADIASAALGEGKE